MTTLLMDEAPLMVIPSLAVAIGVEGALVLQQIHYWSLKAQTRDDGRPWVYNTVKQWADQFPFWSDRTVRRILADLKSKGVLEVEEFNAYRGDRTPFYAINYEALEALSTGTPPSAQTRGPSGQNARMVRPKRADHQANLAASIEGTETTTETTTEITGEPAQEKPKRSKRTRSKELTFSAWLETIDGDVVISEDDPIYGWMDQAKIPEAWQDLPWRAFCDRFTDSTKTYADWRAAFRNYVREGWLQLWRVGPGGTFVLTDKGLALRHVIDAEAQGGEA